MFRIQLLMRQWPGAEPASMKNVPWRFDDYVKDFLDEPMPGSLLPINVTRAVIHDLRHAQSFVSI